MTVINVFRNSGRVVLGLAVAFAMSLATSASAADTGTVKGKVLGQDGNGVAGAQVTLRPPPEKGKAPAAPAAAQDEKQKPAKPVAKTTTEADGSFTMADVPVGDYVVMARSKEQGQAREKVSVKAGETAEVKLTLKQGKQGGGKKKDKAE